MSVKNIELSDLFFNYVKQNKKCLIINDFSETNFEKLSFIFQDVTSIIFNESMYEKKFSTSNYYSNFKFLDITNFKNFFQKNTFDLIVISNWPKMESITSSIFLEEINIILKENGNVIFLFQTNKNFTELKIEKILKYFNFTISKNWIAPSLQNPLYYGNFKNLNSLMWFLQNLENFIPSFKKKSFKKNLFLKFIKIFSVNFLSIFLNFLSPSLLIYCSKNQSETFESYLLKKTNLKSSILLNRSYKIMYILFDEMGDPKKTISINKKNLIANKNNNFFQNLEKNSIYRNWIEGRIIDPLNSNEILLAIEWIIKFQYESRSNEKLNFDLNKKIDLMKKYFSKNLIDDLPLIDWLNNYENFVNNLIIYKTNVHGDLSHKNMIISPSKIIDVIDFDFFKDSGNPFDDISNFLFRYLIKSKHESNLDSFSNKLCKHGSFYDIINAIEEKLSEHFNIKISIILLMKIFFTEKIFIRSKENLPYQHLLPYAKILSKL